MAETKKKLAILGTATNRGEAPFDDDSWDIWGVSGVFTQDDVKRVDRIYEMHPKRFWGNPAVIKVLQKFPGEVVMMEPIAEVPNSIRYPIEEVHKTFYMDTMEGHLCITNTVGFMLAHAYLEGYKHIETWGVYMEHGTEYEYQRSNCEFFVGFLHAKRVHVLIHGGEVLKAKFTYCYEEPEMLIPILEDAPELKRAEQDLIAQLEAKKRELYMQQGAIAYNAQVRKRAGGY